MRKFILLLTAVLIITYSVTLLRPAQIQLATPQLEDELLLVPLDSRPVCSTMVQKLGMLAGINVIVPPKELLDNYQKGAEQEKLWQWLQYTTPRYSESIISADLLLHGSLLNTRQHLASQLEQEHFGEQLQKVYSQKLTLFSIIPRLLVSDEVLPDRWYQYHLMRYSQLKDMVEINNDYAMTAKLMEFTKDIPSEILHKYENLYTQSESFNTMLLNELCTNSSATALELLIGQDDSNPFGLPHRTAKHLQNLIIRNKLTSQANLTYGADEIGALLLARHYLRTQNFSPRIKIIYSSPRTEFKHMPYMAASCGATLRNQIELLGAKLTEESEAADFVLYVHCGDDDNKPRVEQARELKKLLQTAKHVALIDLSANFEASEMLLPLLLSEDVELNKLTAYAGWNTFSNSSGTALSQAAIFTGRLRAHPTPELCATNLNFTIERILEDYYYQKCIHPELRPYLESFGTTPTNLEPEEKQATEYYIHKRLALAAEYLFYRNLCRTPFYENYYLTKLTVGARLPWNRIFEVELDVHTSVQELHSAQ